MTQVVEALSIFPLAGAQGIPAEGAWLTPGGFASDHELVLYNASGIQDNEPAVCDRIGAKQCRDLAQLVLEPLDHGGYLVQRDPIAVDMLGVEPWSTIIPAGTTTTPLSVMEFGDPTPAFDMGNDTAAAFAEYTGIQGARLARKSPGWMMGRVIPPVDRKVATVHIAVADTVDELAAALRCDGHNVAFGADRLRAQVVVRGAEPHSEQGWIGRQLRIGNAVLAVDRPTERCLVPGLNPHTGQKMGDVTRAYIRHTPKAPSGAPAIGVYAHPVTPGTVRINVGDEVALLK